jgi:O-antigen ligase
MLEARTRRTGMLVAGSLLLLSLALGRVVVETQAIQANPGVVLLGALGVMVAVAIMVAGPVPCLAAIAALTVLPLLPQASLGGGVDLFAADAFFGALVVWWLLRTAGLSQRPATVDPPSVVPGAPVLILLAYVGLTLLYVATVDPDRLSVSLVSWLRLVETASLGWLAATFLRTRRDVTLLLGAVAAAGAVAVVVALVGGVGDADSELLGDRGGGILNPNALGLGSGLLVLLGALGALGRSPLHRVPLALLGAVGLVQSQSVGSIVATSVALLLALAFMVTAPRRVVAARALRAAMVLGIALGLAYALAVLVRPSNLPTSEGFRGSSTAQRAVLAAAGLELAERHPLIGVGWRRSDDPAVIGDPEVNRELRARFRTTSSAFFPDVSPSSVHNAYVQVLADLGVIGLGLLAFVLVSLARGIGLALRSTPRGTPGWAGLWFLAWAVVLILVWWNDNPIYGGQQETVVLALFVGAIAGLARRAQPPPSASR